MSTIFMILVFMILISIQFLMYLVFILGCLFSHESDPVNEIASSEVGFLNKDYHHHDLT